MYNTVGPIMESFKNKWSKSKQQNQSWKYFTNPFSSFQNLAPTLPKVILSDLSDYMQPYWSHKKRSYSTFFHMCSIAPQDL